MNRRLELAVSAVLLVLPIFLFAVTFSEAFDVFTFGGDVGPAFAPRVYLVLWACLAASTIWMLIRPVDGNDGVAANQIKVAQLIYVVLIASATSYGVIAIGFLFATIPGFFLFCWAFGYRKIPILAALSIGGPVVIWAMFTFGFKLILPKSPWFHFF